MFTPQILAKGQVPNALLPNYKNSGAKDRSSQGLIVQSNRGSHYCSQAYHKIIKQHHFKGSMSGKGIVNRESFQGIFKNVLIYHQDYKIRFTAINEITQYIELYFNQTRTQKGLEYRSPRQIWFDYYCQAAQLKSLKFKYTDLTVGVFPNHGAE